MLNTKRDGLFVLMVVLAAFYGAWHPIRLLLHSTTADILFHDPIDAPLLVAGMESVTNFAGTLKWWYGPWTMGADYAFYRPLTSLGFWLQYQAFGREGLAGFMIVHAASHVAVAMSAFLFLRELLGVRVAAISVAVFAMSLTLTPYYLPSAYPAMQHWKDQPDLWYSTPYILSLWAFTCFLKRDDQRFLLSSIALFIVGILVKEAAYTLPFATVLLLWYRGKVASHWKCVIPFFGVAAGMFAFRFWALQGMGFRFGTNGSWFSRWLSYTIGGKPMAEITQGYLWPVTIACTVAAILWFLFGRNRIGVLYLLVVTVVFFAINWARSHDMEDPFYYAVVGDVRPWVSAAYTLSFIFLVWRFFCNKNTGQIFGWLWVLLTYLPMMTAPITEHGLYLVSLGWSVWLTYAAQDIFNIVSGSPSVLRLLRKTSHRTPESSLLHRTPTL